MASEWRSALLYPPGVEQMRGMRGCIKFHSTPRVSRRGSPVCSLLASRPVLRLPCRQVAHHPQARNLRGGRQASLLVSPVESRQLSLVAFHPQIHLVGLRESRLDIQLVSRVEYLQASRQLFHLHSRQYVQVESRRDCPLVNLPLNRLLFLRFSLLMRHLDNPVPSPATCPAYNPLISQVGVRQGCRQGIRP